MTEDEDLTSSTDDAAVPTADKAAVPAARPPRPSPASRARRIGGGVSTPSTTAPARPPAGPKSAPTSKSVAMTKPAATLPGDGPAERGQAPADPAAKPRPPAPAWLNWVPAAVFAALAAAFLVLIIVDKTGNSASSNTSAKQRQTVLAGAKNCVAATNTYKYTNVDFYEKAGLKCATGVYAGQYRNAMDTLIKKNAPTQKFTQIAQVNTAGIESVTANGKQWNVLIYGQLNITNNQTGKQGRIDPFALVATMESVKGNWLIAKVTLLSTVGG
ncbi:MAG: hypothetical protein QOF92_547 [Pseudonocardiales bacterium]|jgi:hypothetical protein|nr:hypothetical protein [Pseudonocardiales bacterium]